LLTQNWAKGGFRITAFLPWHLMILGP